jgi:hypothetical protein
MLGCLLEGVDAVIGEVVSISDTGEHHLAAGVRCLVFMKGTNQIQISLKLEYEGGLQPPHLNRVYFEEPK